MLKLLTVKRVLLLAVLLLTLGVVAAVSAQEATAVPAGEATVEAPAEEAHGEVATTAVAEGETGGGIEALGLNAGYLLAQIINFSIIFIALRLLLWKPILNMLDARTTKIEKGLEDAAVAANARRNAEVEAEKITASARAEVGKAIEEGRLKGEDVRKQVVAEANADAEKIRADARIAAESERDQQLAGLRGQVAAISIAAAQKLIGEALDQKRQQALIDDFFAKVPDSAKKLGGNVEVVSAMPLTDAEQAKAKQETGADQVTFTVDPSILGGLIVRSGERVVDGSVRSGLNDLASRLS